MFFFFFQAEDGIRDLYVTGVQTCALPIYSDQYGQAFAGFLAEHAKAKLGVEPKDVKVALIHEDGPYGVGVAAADQAYAKEAGLNVVLKEGYSASSPDLSVLVTKIKRAGVDV